eukprot:Nk52_evm37s2039 gene=Nk52_evmTU37s2039
MEGQNWAPKDSGRSLLEKQLKEAKAENEALKAELENVRSVAEKEKADLRLVLNDLMEKNKSLVRQVNENSSLKEKVKWFEDEIGKRKSSNETITGMPLVFNTKDGAGEEAVNALRSQLAHVQSELKGAQESLHQTQTNLQNKIQEIEAQKEENTRLSYDSQSLLHQYKMLEQKAIELQEKAKSDLSVREKELNEIKAQYKSLQSDSDSRGTLIESLKGEKIKWEMKYESSKETIERLESDRLEDLEQFKNNIEKLFQEMMAGKQKLLNQDEEESGNPSILIQVKDIENRLMGKLESIVLQKGKTEEEKERESQFKEDIQAYKGECERLRNKIQSQYEEGNKIAVELATTKSQIELLQNQLREKQSGIKLLVQQNEDLTKDLNRSQSHNEGVRNSEIKQTQEYIDKLKKELSIAQEAVKEKASNVVLLQKENSQMEQTLFKLTSEIESTKNSAHEQGERLQRKVALLEKLVEKTQAEMEKKEQKFEWQLEKVCREKESLLSTIEKLREEGILKSNELLSLTTSAKQNEAALKSLEGLRPTRDELVSSLQKAETSLSAHKLEIVSLKDKLESRIAQLEEARNNLNRELADKRQIKQLLAVEKEKRAELSHGSKEEVALLKDSLRVLSTSKDKSLEETLTGIAEEQKIHLQTLVENFMVKHEKEASVSLGYEKWLQMVDRATEKMEKIQKESYEEKINVLKMRVVALESEVHDKEQALLSQQEVNGELQSRVKAMETQVASSRRDSVELEKGFSKAKKDSETSYSVLMESVEKSMVAQEALKAQNSQLHKEINAKEKKIADFENQMEKYKSDLLLEGKKSTRLQEKVQELQISIGDLKSSSIVQTKEIECLNSQIRAEIAAKEATEKENVKFKSLLDEQDNVLKKKEKEIAYMENRMSLIEETNHDVIGRKDSIIVKCQQEAVQVRKSGEEEYKQMQNRLEGEIELLKLRLQDAEKNHRDAIAKKDDNIAELKGKVEDLGLQSASKQEHMLVSADTTIRTKVEELESIKNSSFAQIKELELNAKGLQERYDILKNEREKERHQMESMKSENLNLTNEVCELKVKLAETSTETGYMKKEVESLRQGSKTDLKDWSTMVSGSMADLKDVITKAMSAEASMEEEEKIQKDEANGLREEISSLRKKLSEKDNKLTVIEEELSEIKMNSPIARKGVLTHQGSTISMSDLSVLMDSREQKDHESLSEINRLKLQLEDKHTKFAEAEKKLEKKEMEHEKSLSKKEAQLEKYNTMYETLKNARDNENAKHKEYLEGLNHTIRNLEFSLKSEMGETKALEKTLHEAVEKHSREVEDLRKSHVEKLNAFSKSVEIQLQEKEREIGRLRELLEKTQNQKAGIDSNFQATNNKLNAQILEMQNLIVNLKNENALQKSQLDQAEKSNGILLSTGTSQADQSMIREMQALERKNEYLELKLENAKSERERLEKEKERFEHQLQREKREIEDELFRQKSRTDLDHHTLKLELSAEISTLKGEKGRIQELLNSERMAKESLSSTNGELKKEIDSLKASSMSSKNDQESNIYQLRRDIDMKADEIKRLSSELSESQKSHMAEVSILRNDLNASKNEIMSKTMELEHVKASREVLNSESAQKEAHFKVISETLNAQTTSTQSILQDEIALLKQQLSSSNASFVSAEEYIAKMQKEHNLEMKSLYEKSQKAVNKLQVQLQTIQASKTEENKNEVHKVKLQLTKARAEAKQYSKVVQESLIEIEKRKKSQDYLKECLLKEQTKYQEVVKEKERLIEDHAQKMGNVKDETSMLKDGLQKSLEEKLKEAEELGSENKNLKNSLVIEARNVDDLEKELVMVKAKGADEANKLTKNLEDTQRAYQVEVQRLNSELKKQIDAFNLLTTTHNELKVRFEDVSETIKSKCDAEVALKASYDTLLADCNRKKVVAKSTQSLNQKLKVENRKLIRQTRAVKEDLKEKIFENSAQISQRDKLLESQNAKLYELQKVQKKSQQEYEKIKKTSTQALHKLMSLVFEDTEKISSKYNTIRVHMLNLDSEMQTKDQKISNLQRSLKQAVKMVSPTESTSTTQNEGAKTLEDAQKIITSLKETNEKLTKENESLKVDFSLEKGRSYRKISELEKNSVDLEVALHSSKASQAKCELHEVEIKDLKQKLFQSANSERKKQADICRLNEKLNASEEQLKIEVQKMADIQQEKENQLIALKQDFSKVRAFYKDKLEDEHSSFKLEKSQLEDRLNEIHSQLVEKTRSFTKLQATLTAKQDKFQELSFSNESLTARNKSLFERLNESETKALELQSHCDQKDTKMYERDNDITAKVNKLESIVKAKALDSERMKVDFHRQIDNLNTLVSEKEREIDNFKSELVKETMIRKELQRRLTLAKEEALSVEGEYGSKIRQQAREGAEMLVEKDQIISSKEAKYNDCQRRLKDATQKLCEYEDTIATMESMKRQYSIKSKEFADKIHEISQVLSTKDRLIHEMNDRINVLVKEKADYTYSASKYQELSQAIADAKGKNEEIIHLQAQVKSSQSDLSMKHELLLQREHEVSTLKAEIQNLRQNVSAISTESTASSSLAGARLKGRIAELEEVIDDATREKSKLKRRMEDSEETHEKILKDLKNEQQKCCDQEKEIEHLKFRVLSAEQMSENFKGERSSLQLEVQKLKSLENEARESHHSELDRIRAGFEKERHELNADYHKEKEILLKEHEHSMQVMQHRLEEDHNLLVKNYEETIANLRKEHIAENEFSAKQLKSMNESFENETNRLKHQLGKLDKEIDSKSHMIEDEEKMITNLQHDVTEKLKFIEKEENELHLLQNQLHDKQAREQTLSTSIHELRAKLGQKETQVNSLISKLKAITEQLHSRDDAIQARDAIIKEQREEITRLKVICKEEEREIEKDHKKLEQMTSELSEKRLKIAEEESEISALTRKLKEEEDKNLKLQRKIMSEESLIEKLRHTVDHEEEDIRHYKELLEEKDRKVSELKLKVDEEENIISQMRLNASEKEGLISSLNRKLHQDEHDIEKLKREKEEEIRRARELNSKWEEDEMKIKILDHKLEQENHEIQDLSAKLELKERLLSEKLHEIESEEHIIKELKSILQEKEALIHNLEKEVFFAKEHLRHNEEESLKHEKNFVEQERLLLAAHASVEAITKQRDDYNQNLIKIESQVNQLNDELKRQTERHSSEMKQVHEEYKRQLEKQKIDYDDKAQKVESEFLKAQEEKEMIIRKEEMIISSSKLALEEKEKETVALQENLRSRIEELKVEREKDQIFKHEIERLEREYDSMKEEKEVIQKQLHELGAGTVTDLKVQIEHYKTAFEDRDLELRHATEKYEKDLKELKENVHNLNLKLEVSEKTKHDQEQTFEEARQRLVAAVTAKENEIAMKGKKLAAIENELAVKEDVIKRTNENGEKMKLTISNLTSEKAALEKDLATQQRTIYELELKLNQQEDKCKELKEKTIDITRKTKEIENEKSELKALVTKREKQIEDIHLNEKNVENALTSSQSENATLRNDIASLKDKIGISDKEILALQVKMIKYESEISSEKEKTNAQKQQVEELKESLKDAKANFSTLQKELSDKLHDSGVEIDNSLVRYNDLKYQYEKELNEKSVQIQRLEKDFEYTKAALIDQKEQEKRVFENAKSLESELQAELGVVKAQIEIYQKELKSSRESEQMLRSEMITSAVGSENASREKLLQMEREKDAIIIDLTSQVEGLKTDQLRQEREQREQNFSFKEKESILRLENSALKAQVEDAQKECNSAKEKQSLLGLENSTLKAKVDDIKSEYNNAKEKESLLGLENSTLKAKVDDIKSEYNNAKEKESLLGLENSTLKAKVEEAQNEYKDFREKEAILRLENSNLKVQIENLQQTCNNFKEKESFLRLETSAVKEQVENIREKYNDCKEKESFIRLENVALKAQMEDMEKKYNAISNEVHNFKSQEVEIQGLQAKLISYQDNVVSLTKYNETLSIALQENNAAMNDFRETISEIHVQILDRVRAINSPGYRTSFNKSPYFDSAYRTSDSFHVNRSLSPDRSLSLMESMEKRLRAASDKLMKVLQANAKRKEDTEASKKH